jgi:carbon-monoxide dehydrogenase medium subunit
MDLAVVGLAARVSTDGPRNSSCSIAIGGAAPTPLVVDSASAPIVGALLSDAAAFEAAAAAVTDAANPIDDGRGTREYRRNALRTLMRRVLEHATERARSRELER